MSRLRLIVTPFCGVIVASGTMFKPSLEAFAQNLERSFNRDMPRQSDRDSVSPAWGADPGRARMRAQGRDSVPTPSADQRGREGTEERELATDPVAPQQGRPDFSRSIGQRWPSPEFRSSGVRLGAFEGRPYLSVVEIYDSNIYATEDDPTGDFITTLQPGFSLRSDWSRHAIGFRVSGDFGFYGDNSSENYQDFSVGGDGRVDILYGTFLSLDASFDRGHTARSSPDSSAASEGPKIFHRSSGAIALTRDRGLINATIDGTVSYTDFHDGETMAGATIDNDDEDNLVIAPGVRVGYAPSPSSEVYARARFVNVTYTNTPSGAPSDDSWGIDAIVGVSRTFDDVWSADAYVGYAPRFFEDGARENIGGATGIVGGANVLWNPTADFSALFNVSQGSSATTSGGASAISTTGVGLTLEKEVSRRVLVDASFGFRHADYVGTSRIDQTYTAGAGGEYLINPWASVTLDYGYTNRDSSEAGSSYDQHRVGLGMSLRY